MCDQFYFEVCRLCLNSGAQLINIFDENNKLELMLEKTIEELIDVKVVKDAGFPWLVCSTCREKLTDFREFKRRSAVCVYIFYNRIRNRSCSLATKDWINQVEKEVIDVSSHDNKGVQKPGEDLVEGTSSKVWAIDQSVGTATVEMEETYTEATCLNLMDTNNCNRVEIQFPGVIKKWVGDNKIASDALDTGVDVPDDMIVIMGEFDGAGEFSVAPEKEHLPTVASMQEVDCHWSTNEDSENTDHLKGGELCLPLNKEVDVKDECGIDIPQDEAGVVRAVSEVQDSGQKQDGAGKNAAGDHRHTCRICSKVFAQYDDLKAHVMRVHLKRGRQLRCDVCSKAFECKSDLDGHVKSVHIMEKKHQCQHCSRRFKYPNELGVHMSTHTVDGLYRCASCSKGFTRNSYLKRHMLSHSGERPHKCGVCSKSFTLKHHLKEHAFTHAPVVPH